LGARRGRAKRSVIEANPQYYGINLALIKRLNEGNGKGGEKTGLRWRYSIRLIAE
jgi:hypothetical protein